MTSWTRLEHCLSHGVQRVLNRLAVVLGEGVEQRLPHRAPRRTEVDVERSVPPRRRQRCGEQPVACFRQRREFVAWKAGERGVRRFQDRQIGDAGVDQRPLRDAR